MDKKCVAVIVTSDKCYENPGDDRAFSEADRLGGHDPYSASKAACETVIAAYRDSFFRDGRISLASARAGNVIGAGDWVDDRLIPDCIRVLTKGLPVAVRNPGAVRLWQHVLEPLSGYLRLAECLTSKNPRDFVTAFNFGPAPGACPAVLEVISQVLSHWSVTYEIHWDETAPSEARMLSLSTERAVKVLGWQPNWDFQTAIGKTIGWYQTVLSDPEAAQAFTESQISKYENSAQGFQGKRGEAS